MKAAHILDSITESSVKDGAEAAFYAITYATFYGHDVKNTPEKEASIAKDPEWSYRYARDFLKSRFLPGEPIIAKSGWAFMYACDVIHGRWPEAEQQIKYNGSWNEYLDWLISQA